MGISVIILTHNEEKHIENCIKSCPFADEIILIDDNSTDNTISIATKLGAKVVNHPLNGDFGAQRNFGIEQAKEDWILFLDADERCSKELINNILEIKDIEPNMAYEIERKVKFKYNKVSYGTMRPDYVIRLLPRKGAHVEGKVHEAILSTYPKKRIKGYLEHYTYDNFDQYFNKINTYAKISAEKYIERNKQPHFIRDVVFRPHWAFFKTYILDRGFLDGKIGFVLAISHYYYTFQKYARLYYLHKTNGKF